ncbi:MAG: calcium-binding protein [Leptolyngbyaceae cyanobacterium]
MRLYQRGNHLILYSEDVDDVSVVLLDFSLENLDNLPNDNSGNVLFNENVIRDRFDVFNANSRPKRVFHRNTVTFLNDLNNTTRGFDNSNDVINGQGGNDTLTGLSGDDLLRGESGDDRLDGGAGDDILQGGKGNDYLDGGAGFDQFLLYKTGTDIIGDFKIGEDIVVLPDTITLNEVDITHRIGAMGKVDTIVAHKNGEVLAVLEGIEASKEEIFPDETNP